MAKTILLADDDKDLMDSLKDILGDEGYALLSAATCAEALALVGEQDPQVALLDVKLPDGSGVKLLADLKEIRPDCVFAMMTAFADLDSAVAALEKGACQYLQKPIQPVELLKLLEGIFENIQIREEKRRTEAKLRESEERFRTIFETARDAIFLKDKDLRYTLVNPSMERLFGIKATAFIGRTDEDLFGTEDGARTRQTEARVLNNEIIEEEQNRTIEGVPRTFHSIKVPISGDAGTMAGICGFTRTSPKPNIWKPSFCRHRKWRPSEHWRAAFPTILTTCFR